MRVPNLVPIGPQAATCIRPEGYTDTHTLSYIDIDIDIYIGSRKGVQQESSNNSVATN